MKLKLACADFTFPLLSHEQSLDVIAMLGFDGVDIGLFEERSHLWPAREFRNVAKSAGRLADKLARRGLSLADIYLIPATSFEGLAPNHPSKRVRSRGRDQFQRAVEFTRLAGGRHLSGLPGICWPGEPERAGLERGAEELAWRAAFAADSGVVFGIEPHVGSIVPTPEKTGRLLDMAPGLTLTLDYCHFTCAGIPDSRIEPLVAHASHFHFRGARKGRLQAPFQDNTIDYARVVRAMRRSRYDGYIGVEYVWINWEHCNETDNLSETVLFRDFLRKLKTR